MSMVYVIESHDGYSKVGVSNSPTGRLAALQTGNPNKLTLCNYIDLTEVPEVPAYEVERLAQSYLKLFRVNGEWFRAPRQLIACCVDRAIWELYKPVELKRWRRRFKTPPDATPHRLVWFSLMEGKYTNQEMDDLIASNSPFPKYTK